MNVATQSSESMLMWIRREAYLFRELFTLSTVFIPTGHMGMFPPTRECPFLQSLSSEHQPG